MPHLTLSPFVASYQSNTATMIQQNNRGTLLLSHRVYGSSIFQYDLALTLMAPPVDFSFCELDSVLLELPIQRFRFHHPPLYNRVIVSSNSTFPTERLGVEISPSSFLNGFLMVDITSLFRNWNATQTPIYKLTVSLELPDLSIRVRNRSAVFPRIQVDYRVVSYDRFASQMTDSPLDSDLPSNKENTSETTSDEVDSYTPASSYHNIYPNTTCYPILPCYPASTVPSNRDKHPYIEVCSVNSDHCFIESNGIFMFHSIDSSSDISYSADTGHFTFTSAGIYYVNWMLYLRGTGAIEWIKIGLQNQTTGETFPFNSPCVIPGQICGQHILHVEDISEQYSLINSSESTMQLCSNDTNASLVMFKL